MISVREAEHLILSHAIPFTQERDREVIPLAQSCDRVLAADVRGAIDLPPWHNSAMDGYALRFADLAQYEHLEIAPQTIPAAPGLPAPLLPGQCARIFTGGVLPVGADTVAIQEEVERQGDRLRVKGAPQPGDFVRWQGEFYRAGAMLLPKGKRLRPPDLAVLAAVGCEAVPVWRQPRVALFATGNELIALPNFATQQPGQIVDSNHYALAALVVQAGAIAEPLGIVEDDDRAIAAAIEHAMAGSDVAISSGGVSVGDYDRVAQVLASLGAAIAVRNVAIKPGKPFTVAAIPRSGSAPLLYFGLPGNPVSAIVTFWRFVRGAIAKLSGAPAGEWTPQFMTATTQADLHAQGRRETYLWGDLRWERSGWQFFPVTNYSSGNLVSLSGTTGLAVLPVHQTYVPAGEPVTVMAVR